MPKVTREHTNSDHLHVSALQMALEISWCAALHIIFVAGVGILNFGLCTEALLVVAIHTLSRHSDDSLVSR